MEPWFDTVEWFPQGSALATQSGRARIADNAEPCVDDDVCELFDLPDQCDKASGSSSTVKLCPRSCGACSLDAAALQMAAVNLTHVGNPDSPRGERFSAFVRASEVGGAGSGIYGIEIQEGLILPPG